MTYPKTIKYTERRMRRGKLPGAGPLAVTAAVLMTIFAGGPMAVAGDKVLAIKGGTIYTGTRGSLEGGVILIREGRIEEIGIGIPIPRGAKVVDAAGKFIMPGIVSPDSNLGVYRKADKDDPVLDTALGLSGRNLAWYEAIYSMDPSHDDLALALRNGFTTNACSPPPAGISGLGVVMRPAGRTFESCVVRNKAFLKISFSVDTPFENMFRCSLDSACRKIEGLKAEKNKRKAKKSGEKGSPKERDKEMNTGPARKSDVEPPDDAKRTFMEVVEGSIPLLAECPGADAVTHLMEIVEGYPKIRLVIETGVEGAQAAVLLKERKVPVILEPVVTRDKHWTSYPYATNVTKRSALVQWKDLGTVIAIQAPGNVEDQVRLFDYLNEQRRIGVDRDLLLQGVTIVPAGLLGIEGVVGSLDKGKMADLLIFGSDPLENAPNLERVMLSGVFVR